MTVRAARSALLAAVLIVPAAAGLADTPCDLLPTTNKASRVEPVLCQPCPGGPPVPGARVGGVGLDYVTEDGKRWQCELFRGNRGTGECKKLTTCLPGGDRFFEDGIYKCRYQVTLPGPSNPRESCERGLGVAISRVKDIDGLPLTNNVITKPGPVKLLIEGNGAANATSVQIGGGVGATIGDAARRVGSTLRGTCLPPNCQVVQLDLSNASPGHQTLTLFTPHHFASASVDLEIAGAPVPVVAGDAECTSPQRQSHVEIRLSSNQAAAGQSVSGNQVILNLAGMSPGHAWHVTLHQSFLQAVSPDSFGNSTIPSSPLAFTYTTQARPPQAANTGAGSILPARAQPALRRCVWARLVSSFGTEIVAAPVGVN